MAEFYSETASLCDLAALRLSIFKYFFNFLVDFSYFHLDFSNIFEFVTHFEFIIFLRSRNLDVLGTLRSLKIVNIVSIFRFKA